MSFRINTNVSSIQAHTSLNKVSRETEGNYSKLASGQRIVKAADDAAGLAISEKLKSEIRSSRQANRNANDGLSLVQVAEGGLDESSSILTRMRELAIQAASDTLGDSERSKSNIEYQALKSELDRISQNTEFNGRKLLTGSGPQLDFQVGVGDDTADDHISYQANKINSSSMGLGIASVSINSKIGAQESLRRLDSAIDSISGQRSLLGSIQNRLITSSKNLEIYHENMSAANSRIRDLDYAVETANLARNEVVTQAGTAVMAQANMSPQKALKLLD